MLDAAQAATLASVASVASPSHSKSKPIWRWVVRSILLQHSDWMKSKQGQERRRALSHVRSERRPERSGRREMKGLLENLLSFCVNKSGRRGREKSRSAAVAAAARTEDGRQTFQLFFAAVRTGA